jgi:hypothetical protein
MPGLGETKVKCGKVAGLGHAQKAHQRDRLVGAAKAAFIVCGD